MQRNGKRIGWLKCDAIGSQTQEVEVVKVTPKRVRIRAISLTRLWTKSRGGRYLRAGDEWLFPHDRVFLDAPGGEPRPS